ncbi:MAG: hypothetical protein F4Z26_01150 [Acidimicrobiaceae bacterium]|nr:hypothetical protein [Acidimicrobiaceae bacterium]MYE64339.1 hypothetical protein [Acidimicrobiaceae bacterium]
MSPPTARPAVPTAPSQRHHPASLTDRLLGCRHRAYPRTMPRLFVAVWPPDDVVRELAAMPRPEVDGLRWTKPERLHITLRFLGQCDEAEAAGALRRVSYAPATVTLGPTLKRLGRGVVMLPASGVDGLAMSVTEATGHLGQPPPNRRFTGHMTVARFRRDPPSGQWPPAGLPTIDATFTVSEMALVRVEPSGAYVNVERFEPR